MRHPEYAEYQESIKVGVPQPVQIAMPVQQNDIGIRAIIREEIAKALEMVIKELKDEGKTYE